MEVYAQCHAKDSEVDWSLNFLKPALLSFSDFSKRRDNSGLKKVPYLFIFSSKAIVSGSFLSKWASAALFRQNPFTLYLFCYSKFLHGDSLFFSSQGLWRVFPFLSIICRGRSEAVLILTVLSDYTWRGIHVLKLKWFSFFLTGMVYDLTWKTTTYSN